MTFAKLGHTSQIKQNLKQRHLKDTDMQISSKKYLKWTIFFTAFALLLVTGCASNAPLDTLDPAGRKSSGISDLINPIFIIAGIVFIFIQGAVLFIGWKYRVKAPQENEESFDGGYTDEEFPEQVHGHFAAEIGWTIGPTILMAAIALFSVGFLLNLDDVDAAPEEANYPEVEVIVVGQQWWWEYHYYLDGIEGASQPDFVTANEIVIPVNQDVRIYTTSRDVIHSFWIPRLNGKKDAVPGRTTPWVIQSNEIGRFAGQCTEFCGLSHAYMRMYTVSLSETDFLAWVGNQLTIRDPLPEDDPNYEGEQLFISNCSRCHVVNGVTERDVNGTITSDSMAMYGNIEEFRNHSDGTLSQGKYTGAANLTSGAAPNLTHFATRSSYSGSFFELYPGAQEIADQGNYLGLPGSDYSRGTLEAWLRNSPKEKPNAQPEQARGMPNLNLSEAQIDLLVDYLVTLD
ncbi:MAG: cytochrome c oxidase subunit II [Acidimicrobiaceae bacterium]|nr:cytochrome c oxidase subunit II [Acidimicrobiaceae bacterium]